jgi:hypothetical protein
MDSRETRSYAREIKFMTGLDLRPRILEWSRANLEPDGYGAGAHRDEYATSTLYFETPAFDVYRRRGSYGRSKYRIRRYGLSSVIFLERKFRTERLLSKRRTTVPVADLDRLADSGAHPDWQGFWFHRRVVLRQLRPLIQLSYDRVARVGHSSAGPIRMTIDTNLHVLPMPDRAFLPGVGLPIIEDKCIIELKYRVHLPPVFKSLVETFGLEVQRVSKFRVGVRALDYPLPKDADEEVPHAMSDIAAEEAAASGYFD